MLIAVVGNSGVGKTTFARQLCRAGPFECGLEQHTERPFQASFSQQLPRYAFANQVDYLLFRAEQEAALRKSGKIAILDGGLDQDFFVFTRHFYRRGFLTGAEYGLCERLYRFFRQLLLPPDWIIYLRAPLDVVAGRHAQRSRGLEIAKLADLESLETLLGEWLDSQRGSPVLTIDAASEDASYSQAVQIALGQIPLS